MTSKPDEPQSETPLGDLLPPRVKGILERNGIHTVEALHRAYPLQLLKIHGVGMLRLRQIEAAFFPGQLFTYRRRRLPVYKVKNSALNGPLSPGVVQLLVRNGITTADQLVAMDPALLLKIRGLGLGKLQEIKRAFFS